MFNKVGAQNFPASLQTIRRFAIYDHAAITFS